MTSPSLTSISRPAASTDVPARGFQVRRAVIVLAACSLLAPLAQTWTTSIAFPAAGLASDGLVGAVMVLLVLAWRAADPVRLARVERWLLVTAALVLIVGAAASLQGVQGYATDEGALQQGAALALLHGHDPYGANLSNALYGWTSGSIWYTYLLDGHVVTSFSYPALSILATTPFVALTGGGQGVSIAYLMVLLLTMGVMFRVLPTPLKAVSILVCAGFPQMLSGALAGETELLAVLFMLWVAAGWTQVGSRAGFRRSDAANALALGLAISVSPIAWFMAAFVIVGIALVNLGRQSAAQTAKLLMRYAAVSLATFLAVDLPFIIWRPLVWGSSMVSTLTQHAVPMGQGLISLALFGHLGGGDLSAFNAAALAATLTGLLAYVLWFRRIGGAGFVLAVAGLFLSSRALSGYWIFAVAVMIVAVACEDRGALAGAPDVLAALRRRMPVNSRVVVAVLAFPTCVLLCLAFTARAPLVLRAAPVADSTTALGIAEFDVSAVNRSGVSLRPRFTVALGARSTPFWSIVSGPRRLGPHSAADYIIRAQDGPSEPSGGEPYIVQAETAQPETVSSAPTGGAAGAISPAP